jgi:hypothetical protein
VGDFDELEGHDPALEEVAVEPVKKEKKEDAKPDVKPAESSSSSKK